MKNQDQQQEVGAVDTLLSKGKGLAEQVSAKFKGLVGVFATLAKQHGEVSALLDRVKRDAAKRSEMWPKIRAELLSHEQGEIREVYPVFREHEQTRSLADHHDREASQLSATIAKLDNLPYDSAAWGAAFDQLVDLVTHHVEEEENEIFPKGQAAMGEDRARALDVTFGKAKEQLVRAV